MLIKIKNFHFISGICVQLSLDFRHNIRKFAVVRRSCTRSHGPLGWLAMIWFRIRPRVSHMLMSRTWYHLINTYPINIITCHPERVILNPSRWLWTIIIFKDRFPLVWLRLLMLFDLLGINEMFTRSSLVEWLLFKSLLLFWLGFRSASPLRLRSSFHRSTCQITVVHSRWCISSSRLENFI